MNKKDVALTVGGILATMAVSYLVYRMQKKDAAAAAANQDAAAQAAYNQAAQQESYLAAVSLPAYQGIATTTAGPSTSSAVDTTTSIDPHTTASLLDGFEQQMSILAGQASQQVVPPLAPSATANRQVATGNLATPLPGVRLPYNAGANQ